MTFKLSQNPTFKVKVTVPVPNDKGGHDKNTFVAVFKRTSTDELRELQERRVPDVDVIRERMVDWELVDADTNDAVPFSQDNLDALLQIQPSPRFIAQAFFDHVLGGKT